VEAPAGMSSATSAKCPRWLTPMVLSKPSDVRDTAAPTAPRSGAMPALHTTALSGRPEAGTDGYLPQRLQIASNAF
jgi:hypothetical protein